MENTDLIKQYIEALDVSLDDLEPAIKDLTAKSFEDRINETSDEHERIKIANGYAYILTSLAFAFLKSKGVDTNNHPIVKDLSRVKSYMNRAKEAKEPKKDKVIDTGAAKRFIEAALNNGTGNSTVIRGTPEPAISSASFQGKHTKFDASQDEEEENTPRTQDQTIRKNTKNDSSTKNKNIKTNDKVKKPKKEKKKITK